MYMCYPRCSRLLDTVPLAGRRARDMAAAIEVEMEPGSLIITAIKWSGSLRRYWDGRGVA